MDESKAMLHRYLTSQRDAVLWKVRGIDERAQRLPMTPTGTNLLGLVKHLASVEAEYFGSCIGRPFPEPMPWIDSDDPNADMYATADESSADVIGLYERVIAHADAGIEALDLDAPARVPWWGDRADTTLGRLVVHMTAETARHAGHMDIVRELLDGSAGLRAGVSNLPEVDDAWWPDYVERLRSIADATA